MCLSFLFWQPECSVLLDALEQSAYNPEVSVVLAKSLLHILKLSAEKTVLSFKTLEAISRVLRVACIQAQESRRYESTTLPSDSIQISQRVGPYEKLQKWHKSIKTLIELFQEYISTTEDAKYFVLCSSTCVDCLFDLFWEKDLRKDVLTHILDLMKVVYHPFLLWISFATN